MAKKTRKMTKRKKVIFAFIVVIILVLMFSVVGVSVLYLGGNQAQQNANQNTVDLSDLTVVPSVDDTSIAIEAQPTDNEAETENTAPENDNTADTEAADLVDEAADTTNTLPEGEE